MTSDLLVCWIDADYDRSSASDGVSRYGAYLVGHAELFDPWQDAGPDRMNPNGGTMAMRG